MKLAIAIIWLCFGLAYGMRANNLYKTKRIIKVRVPPRQYPDYYNGPKGHLRPKGAPFRFKEYHEKHPEFSRPNFPPFYNNYNIYNNLYVKHQSRPPPGIYASGFPSAGNSFGSAFKGFTKEINQKLPLNYGSNYPHKASFSTFKFPSVKDEIRIAHTQTFSAPVTSIQTPTTVSPPVPSHSSLSGSYSSIQQPTSYYESNSHAHVQSSDDNRGPIREIPAPNLGPKPTETIQGDEYITYGKGPSIDVTNLVTDSGPQQLSFPATEYYSAFGQPQHFQLVNDNALSTSAGYYESNIRDGVNHESTVGDIEAVSTTTPDIAFKNNQVTPAPSSDSGYEVTEEQHSSSGGSEGDTSSSQFYYAPHPDPSLPVHKVPPTKPVFTDESLAETYVPRVTQNFQILEGGTVAAPLTSLSPQELFHLMHGFPRQIPVVAQPIVTIVGHQQPTGVYLQPTYQYTQPENPQITHQTQYQQIESTQPNYPEPQQYATEYSQVVSNHKSVDSSSNYDHEPEASESQQGNVAKMDEESRNSIENGEPQQENQIIIHFNKIPEVPFYTTLPNKQAAEALATLQAAGSIGSNYVDKIKPAVEENQGKNLEKVAAAFFQANQRPEEEEEDLGPDLSNVELPQQELESEQEEKNISNVEIQKSIPLYETSYAASSLLDDGNASTSTTFSVSSSSSSQSTVKNESFGKRIRPK